MRETRRQLLRWTGAGIAAAACTPWRRALAAPDAERVLVVSCAGAADGTPTLSLIDAEALRVLVTLPAPGAMAFPATRWAFGRDIVWGGYLDKLAGFSLATGGQAAAIETRSSQNPSEITPDGRFVLAAARAANRILKVGAEPEGPGFGRVIESVDHYAGASPGDLTMLADGSYCFTPDRGGDTVSVFQVNPLRKLVTLPLERRGDRPLEPAMATVSPRGEYLFVETARGSGGVLVIDVSNPLRPVEVRRFDQTDGLGMNPATDEFTPDGRFNLIINRASADLTIVDVDRLEIRGRVVLPEGSAPVTGTFAPEGTRFFVPLPGRDAVAVVNVPEFEVTQFIQVGARPLGIAYVETPVSLR